MRWINALVCGALLAATGSVFSNDSAREIPQDYATGAQLETSASSPWYRVTLPPAVYQQVAWPDLRDVRVFNHQGDAVPFTLVAQKTPSVAPQTLPLRLFPLDESPIATQESERYSHESVVLRSKSGLEVHLNGEIVSTAGQSYLLTLPDEVTDDFSLAQLRLQWTTPQASWQGKASVYSSRDLHYWMQVQTNVPLMDLTRDNDRLKIDTIHAQLHLSPDNIHYLLIIVDTHNAAPALTAVSAIVQSAAPISERIVLGSKATRVAENEAIWHWARPQPFSELRIDLQNEGVLPVELAWRSSSSAPWQPLTKTVLYRLNGKISDDIALSGQLVEAIRVTAISAHLPETLPVVSGARDSYQLVFNPQGKSPFILAWGNQTAQKADIGLDMLIPEALRKTQDMYDLPEALVQESVTLGGDARLTATSQAERQSRWTTVLVWGALIFGVGVLLAMAWRIWREVKQGDAE